MVTPGLEEVTAGELRDLRARRVRPVPGGVEFEGDLDLALRANLWLRTASRVLWRLAAFPATSLDDLARGAAGVPWAGRLRPDRPLEVRATCGKSRVTHTGAVAERVAGAIAKALHLAPPRRLGADRVGLGPAAPASAPPAAHAEGPGAEGPGAAPPIQRVRVRLEHDQCTLSLDTSGAHLHQRGYRLETAKAPLRETLAAALLRLTGWRGDVPLVDPLCGAGTLPIEAALLACRLPPGAGRAFALELLPGFDPARRAAVDAEAAARRRPLRVAVRGADRDPGGVAIAGRNAARAGVAYEVTFTQAPLGALFLDGPAGLVVANPPYGRRLGQPAALRDLYATLGAKVAAAPGWRLAVISTEPALLAATGLALEPLCPPVSHAGLRLHLVLGPPA